MVCFIVLDKLALCSLCCQVRTCNSMFLKDRHKCGGATDAMKKEFWDDIAKSKTTSARTGPRKRAASSSTAVREDPEHEERQLRRSMEAGRNSIFGGRTANSGSKQPTLDDGLVHSCSQDQTVVLDHMLARFLYYKGLLVQYLRVQGRDISVSSCAISSTPKIVLLGYRAERNKKLWTLSQDSHGLLDDDMLKSWQVLRTRCRNMASSYRVGHLAKRTYILTGLPISPVFALHLNVLPHSTLQMAGVAFRRSTY